MRQTNLAAETAEYVRAREELRQAEIELMRQREQVADQRRRLPLGPVVDDYVFEEGPADLNAGDEPVREVRLSELFTGPDRDLIIYHFMYGKEQTEPCPMCTMWIDGFSGIAHHVRQNVDFAIVAAAGLPELREHARNRGWTGLRLLSAAKSAFKRDLASEDEQGNQDSTVSVFTRDDNGAVHHVYSVHPRMSEEIDERGIDLLAPVWHILDLTPRGRGDWYPSLDY
ncbi:Predicted dithiol-disulfide oxidoreductase, DUF899 family [Saccharopolyspora antimicrobica]|uniref:Dithiol-disulfide oxidoreductase (DUF899 family) n=1 Tax=Saccharopolyspora antimicrobica TaxID=455193 RepID=A0A1I4WY71_9PSEU|nr:DUF899 family protein [Saccharopolyspora antimicrobica]RKT84192.1 putative dithiol-disulfide oxidoreductase (DUF899 family) [Saccharopolyspora antimicrobica]SFN18153.1 Predicted dithiol-disulfide oxidoreductase, DUF899 family [Saccharopolyspora antimicrobica]